MGKIYVLTEGEDNRSQVQFWKLINNYVYQNTLSIIACNGIGKVSIELCDLIIKKKIVQDDDIVIIDIDNVIENTVVDNSIKRLKGRIKGKEAWKYRDDRGNEVEVMKKLENAYILGLLCFEDTVLKFPEFTRWIYSRSDRDGAMSSNVGKLLRVYDLYVKETGGFNGKYISDDAWKKNSTLIKFLQAGKSGKRVSGCSIEVLADLLLYAMTSNSKGRFKTSKKELGRCFYIECKSSACKFEAIRRGAGKRPLKEDVCGLYYSCERVRRKTAEQKIIALYRYTALHNELMKCKAKLLSRGYSAANGIKIYNNIT